jgi:hypothetical protein
VNIQNSHLKMKYMYVQYLHKTNKFSCLHCIHFKLKILDEYQGKIFCQTILLLLLSSNYSDLVIYMEDKIFLYLYFVTIITNDFIISATILRYLASNMIYDHYCKVIKHMFALLKKSKFISF